MLSFPWIMTLLGSTAKIIIAYILLDHLWNWWNKIPVRLLFGIALFSVWTIYSMLLMFYRMHNVVMITPEEAFYYNVHNFILLWILIEHKLIYWRKEK